MNVSSRVHLAKVGQLSLRLKLKLNPGSLNCYVKVLLRNFICGDNCVHPQTMCPYSADIIVVCLSGGN